jgi:hypothetical protein
MSNPVSTRGIVEGVDPQGHPAVVEVAVRGDGRIALISSTAPAEPVFLSADRAAELRSQLGTALTVSLREARTTGQEPTS